MSVYDPLRSRLGRSDKQMVTFSFSEIEKLIGRPLPRSAHARKEWWSNENVATTTHSQCISWQAAGYGAEVNLTEKTVRFTRKK